MFKLGVMKAGFRPSPSLISHVILGFCFLIFLLWRLGSLVPGSSSAEAASRTTTANLHGLLSNPADAPYRLVQHLLETIHPSLFSLRLASVIFAVIIGTGFYNYVKSLFGRIVGLFGVLFLITLPFYVVSARQATPQIMLFLPAILIYVYAAWIRTQKKTAVWLGLALAVGISLYTPGMIWWLLGAAILSYKKLSANIPVLRSAASGLGVGLFCLTVTPLIIICGLHLSALKTILAIPAVLPNISHFGGELIRMSGAIAVRSPDGGLLLGNLPILNITLLALVVFGGYALFTAAKGKALALGLNVLLAIILAALNSDISFLALAVPALMISAAAGLRYLYVEWRAIFPRNPVPKTFALVLIAIVVLAQLYYAANYSLKAWPNSPSTRKSYMLK